MTDGPDGSGNGEIVRGLREWADQEGLKVFDLVDYQQRLDKLPLYDEIKEFDVILSAEPTFSWIGKAIRDEVTRKNKGYDYSTRSTIDIFSSDREVLYKRVLIPAYNAGKYIFQQRGVVTSIVYQPVQAKFQKEAVSMDYILSLTGNQFAFNLYPPTLLLITKCEADVCMSRLGERKKQDNCLYEELEFQKKVVEVYSSDWLKQMFEERGTLVNYVNTNPPLKPVDTRKSAVNILKKYLKSHKENN